MILSWTVLQWTLCSHLLTEKKPLKKIRKMLQKLPWPSYMRTFRYFTHWNVYKPLHTPFIIRYTSSLTVYTLYSIQSIVSYIPHLIFWQRFSHNPNSWKFYQRTAPSCQKFNKTFYFSGSTGKFQEAALSEAIQQREWSWYAGSGSKTNTRTCQLGWETFWGLHQSMCIPSSPLFRSHDC